MHYTIPPPGQEPSMSCFWLGGVAYLVSRKTGARVTTGVAYTAGARVTTDFWSTVMEFVLEFVLEFALEFVLEFAYPPSQCSTEHVTCNTHELSAENTSHK